MFTLIRCKYQFIGESTNTATPSRWMHHPTQTGHPIELILDFTYERVPVSRRSKPPNFRGRENRQSTTSMKRRATDQPSCSRTIKSETPFLSSPVRLGASKTAHTNAELELSTPSGPLCILRKAVSQIFKSVGQFGRFGITSLIAYLNEHPSILSAAARSQSSAHVVFGGMVSSFMQTLRGQVSPSCNRQFDRC